MRSYNTTTDLQNMPPIEPNTVRLISFHVHGYWHHVRFLGNIGVDQHSNRFFLRGNKIYGEFLPYIISLKNCML
jgi:hypothetical protein